MSETPNLTELKKLAMRRPGTRAELIEHAKLVGPLYAWGYRQQCGVYPKVIFVAADGEEGPIIMSPDVASFREMNHSLPPICNGLSDQIERTLVKLTANQAALICVALINGSTNVVTMRIETDDLERHMTV